MSGMTGQEQRMAGIGNGAERIGLRAAGRLRRGGNAAERTLFALLVALALIFLLLPIVWMIITAFKPNSEAMSLPPKLLFTPVLDNFKTVLSNPGFLGSFLNSAVIAVLTTLLTLFCSSTSSYALTRFRLVGANTLSTLILISRMIPAIVLGLPLYIIARTFGLLDTYFIMVIAITTFALPFQIWLLLGFFAQIPKALDESALIDGCSWYSAFLRVILPIAAPGLAATAIMTFLFSYNDFFFSLILTGKNIKTAPLAVMEYMGLRTFDWGAIMATGVLLAIPTLFIGIVFQRFMIQGMTAGAVKG
ncbi:carbohydrate ABC transporter permease [Paenibacillus lycopersici]|uniref:Carbohydrate ABC transporter permease n=1 Tax=Paenibacillus lycopersici TaxID=2704462 RepID=A0A6C0G2R4_9BACL|nr:carbohydrate ABC transporter permease [Paenibacillus lycopersici]QHT62243.1 carbohydrate ABC transporter permease [Paenibacillus lycopersici]